MRPEKRYSSAENLKKAVLHNYSARNDFTMGVYMLVFGDYTFYLERIFGLSDKGFWSKNLVRLFLTLVSIILSLILCVAMYYITEIMLSA